MQYYRIGVIVRPHGVQGGVKIMPLTDDPMRFRGLNEAFLEIDDERYAIQLSDIGVRPDMVTLKIAGYDTPKAAEKLRGLYICVDAAHARKLPPDTWFIADLVGCEVIDTEGVRHGVVKDVLQTGANDVYELDTGTLIPALKHVLHEVNVEEKRIVVEADVLKEVAVFAD